jgi:hypothetical protein
MSKSVREKYFYSISFNQSAPADTAPAQAAPSNPHSAPGADIYQDNKTREKVVSRLFDARTTELNQLVASLETKLADAESELQTLKMQADLIYGLLSEIRSLRATAHAPLAAQSES